MATFEYPSNAELMEIEQDLIPRLQGTREIFKIMPTEDVDDDLLLWEQMDNFVGLQQVRGINGKPGKVKRTGGKKYMMQPGYYGEFAHIDEKEMTRRRRYGSFGMPIDLTDLIRVEQDRLLERECDLMEYIGWTLLTTGTFAISDKDGVIEHTDAFPLQQFTAAIAWSNLATATPLADLRQIKLLHRGHSVDFGRNATLYLNQTTINNLLNNQNPNDLKGTRVDGGSTLFTLEGMNKIFAANDLPMIMPMDEGYFDETNTFRLYVADGKGCLVGKRKSGTPVASYCLTRNANNADMGPGSYTKIVDNGERAVPRVIEVHRGHNGGPKIPFPASLVRCNF